MNCANHPDIEKVAFCRTCGKPLCANCTREVRGVVYCENCLAARLEGVQPPAAVPVAGFVPNAAVPVAAGRTPNPGLAAVLGFIPGVGAAYNGQFMKGFIHVIAFVILIFFADHYGPITVPLFFFYFFYTSIDAYKTAKAIEMHEPVPDPFGLNRTFGSGATTSTSTASNAPAGALILIGLGIVFLLETMGFHFFNFNRLWPLILIGIGGWLFARRWGLIGHATYDCERCRARCAMGPAVLVTLGLLFLLDTQGAKSFGHTWPLLLVVIGLIKVWQGTASTEGHVDQRPMGGVGPSGPVVGQVQPPSSEVKNG